MSWRHHMSQWGLFYWRVYASLGLNELKVSDLKNNQSGQGTGIFQDTQVNIVGAETWSPCVLGIFRDVLPVVKGFIIDKTCSNLKAPVYHGRKQCKILDDKVLLFKYILKPRKSFLKVHIFQQVCKTLAMIKSWYYSRGPIDVYAYEKTSPPLVQIMTWLVFGAKPLLNQRWCIIDYILGNKCQRNFNQHTPMFT